MASLRWYANRFGVTIDVEILFVVVLDRIQTDLCREPL